MAHLGRVWMAASVAVVQGRSDRPAAEWRAGLRHLHLGGVWTPPSLPSPQAAPPAGTRPASDEADGRDPRGGGAARDERRWREEDAVRRAMFVSCWTPS